jgi:hypothetical protein
VTQTRRGQWRVITASGSAGISKGPPATANAHRRKKIGRPTDYTPEIAREIADQMIDGNSLRAVCQHDDMPDEGTVYRWIARHPEFRDMYAHARELQALRWAEEVLTIADDGTLDPQDRRIRVDTRKWLLSKVLPKVYGDKLTVAGDPKGPIHHVVGVLDLKALSDTELDALEAFAEARLSAIARESPDKGPNDGNRAAPHTH